MNPIETELLELSSVRSDQDPVVSIYLNTRWSDEMQRDRVRLFVRQKVKWAREQGLGPALDRTLDRVEAYVEGLVKQAYDEGVHGVAIFACDGLGLWKTLHFQRPFEQQFTISEIPHLLQLARTVDDYEPVVVAMVDAKGARIFDTAVGELVAETRVQEIAPGRHSMGGWSQLRYQQHITHLIERNQQEAVEHVAFLLDRDPGMHLVLVGPERMVAMFESLLPPRAVERVLARMSHARVRGSRPGGVRDDLLEKVIERLEEHERQVEAERAHQVVGDALAGGLAVIGPQDVVLAANEERIHLLVLSADFQKPGWRCEQCSALAAAGPIECRYCGGNVSTVDLGEALVRRVVRAGGEVDVVEPQPRLQHYDGVGAFLRHRGSVQHELGAASPVPVL